MVKFRLVPANLTFAGQKIHYAWVVVGLAALMRLTSSSFRTSSSVLIPRLVESFGWSYGAVGLGFSIQWIVSGLFGPLAGGMGDRYGVRVTMVVGALLFIAGMVLTGTMSHLWQFYLFFGVLLSSAMGIFQVPLTAAVTLWFRKHLGVGIGILQASQGLGPLVAVPIMLFILNWFGGGVDGIRAAFWLPGLAGGAALLLLITLFHNEPADLGLRPLGASSEELIRRLQRGEVARARSKAFLHQVQRTTTFWNLIGIHFWGCAGHSIIIVYLVAMAEAKGVTEAAAAGTFVALTVSSSITRFVVPVVADRVGSKWAMGTSFFLQTAPVLMLFFANEPWMFYVFATMFGIGFGGEMSAFPIINRQYYGGAPIGATFGWQMMGSGVGMAAGSLAGGQLRDLTGDFTATIALSFTMSLIGVLSILLLPATTRPLLPDWEEALPEEIRSPAPP
ncbi:MAG: MFS transporter [Dehalococcoidia bacterium]|nr:MFS transporter [Dehalococcoidia bacterium]